MAVKVTVWFTVEGDGAPLTAVVVPVFPTMIAVAEDGLDAKFVSPE
jgi:hypothetical protein